MPKILSHKKATTLFLFAALVAVAIFCILGMPGSAFAEEDEELFFTILHSNDEHSVLLPINAKEENETITHGGFARLATVIEEIREDKRKDNEPVLLVNAGDFLGGTAYSWLTVWGLSPELSLLKQIGYDAAVIGNHEYDYGPDVLAEYLQSAGYPQAHENTVMLASNIRVPSEHSLSENDLYKEQTIFELENELKVGVFSLIGEDAISVTGDTGNIEFKDQEITAAKIVGSLQEKNVDMIIALTHSGLEEDKVLAENVDGIDIIIGGHSHHALNEPLIKNETVIVQAGAYTRYVGRLELVYNRDTEKLRVRNNENDNSFLIPLDNSYLPHPEIQQMVQEYTEKLNLSLEKMTQGEFDDIEKKLARLDFTLSNKPAYEETPAGNYIADAMRLVTEDLTGNPVDIAIQANGSIRGSVVPRENKYRSVVSFYDFTNIIGLGHGDDGYPGYSIVSVYLTGEEVHRLTEVAVLLQEMLGDNYFIQFSGISYSYNPRNAILFTIPLLDQPIPTTRAVTEVKKFIGKGIQSANNDEYRPFERNSEKLYHLVTDTYLLSFLPMVGDLLPQLEIIPKNQEGEAISSDKLSTRTVNYKNRELKVWETVAIYATSHPKQNNQPVVPDAYRTTTGRINKVFTFPLVGWIYVGLLVLGGGVFQFIRRYRKKKHNT